MTPGQSGVGFRHDLLEYRGLSQGTRMLGDLIDKARTEGAPVLVAAPPSQLDALAPAGRRATRLLTERPGPLPGPRWAAPQPRDAGAGARGLRRRAPGRACATGDRRGDPRGAR